MNGNDDIRLPAQDASTLLRRRVASRRCPARSPTWSIPRRANALGNGKSTAARRDVDRAVTAARERVSPDGATRRRRSARHASGGAALILREHRDELAWLDAVDTGNPLQAMLYDVEISAAYMDYFAGLVTEIKGDTIPIGAGHAELHAARAARRHRAHRRVQSSAAVRRRASAARRSRPAIR